MAFKMKGNPMSRNFGIGSSSLKMGHKDSPKKMKDESSMKMKDETPNKLKEGKGKKKVDMPDFASPEQVKARTGGGTKHIDKSKIKSPAKLRQSKVKPKRPTHKKDHADILRERGIITKPKPRPKGSTTLKGSAMKLSEADKKKAMENAMPEAEVKGRFTRDRDLEKQMTKLKSEMGVIKRSRYADNEVKQKDLRRVQKQIDALNQKGYFKAKARAGVK